MSPSSQDRRLAVVPEAFPNWFSWKVWVVVFGTLAGIHWLTGYWIQERQYRRRVLEVQEVGRAAQAQLDRERVARPTLLPGEKQELEQWLLRAEADLATLRTFVHSPLAATAVGAQPLVQGFERDFQRRIEILNEAAIGGRLAPFESSNRTQILLLTDLVVTGAAMLSQNHITYNREMDAYDLIRKAARIQHALTRGWGHDSAVIAQRYDLLRAVAGWQIYGYDGSKRFRDEQYSALIEYLIATDPEIQLSRVFAPLARDYSVEEARTQGPQILRQSVMQLFRVRQLADLRGRVTNDIPQLPEGSAQSFDDIPRGNRFFKGLMEGPAVESQYWREVAEITPHHFGYAWKQESGFENVTAEGLYLAGMVTGILDDFSELSRLKEYRRQILVASFVSTQTNYDFRSIDQLNQSRSFQVDFKPVVYPVDVLTDPRRVSGTAMQRHHFRTRQSRLAEAQVVVNTLDAMGYQNWPTDSMPQMETTYTFADGRKAAVPRLGRVVLNHQPCHLVMEWMVESLHQRGYAVTSIADGAKAEQTEPVMPCRWEPRDRGRFPTAQPSGMGGDGTTGSLVVQRAQEWWAKGGGDPKFWDSAANHGKLKPVLPGPGLTLEFSANALSDHFVARSVAGHLNRDRVWPPDSRPFLPVAFPVSKSLMPSQFALDQEELREIQMKEWQERSGR